MEQTDLKQFTKFADALSEPAFAVRDGLVCYANSAFSVFQIGIGTPLDSFFGADDPFGTEEEYACTVAGLPCKARTFRHKDYVLYLLHQQEQTVSVHALSHSVKSIRASLHGLYSSAAALCEQLEEAEDEKTQARSSGLLQEIYRMEHTVRNMELLQQLLCGSYTLKPEQTDVVNCLSELFSHAQELLRYAGIRLTYELPDKLFNGNLDLALLEAVFWNALSNAAANTKDGSVLVRAAHRDRLLQLTFVSTGSLSAAAQSRLFSRYQVPVEDALDGSEAGFGLSVIRQAVMLHGGSVLFAEQPGEKVAFSVTFDLSGNAEASVSSPMPVAHGLDNGLVHLSGVLPRSAYDSRDIL